jgi:hypothetical protein
MLDAPILIEAIAIHSWEAGAYTAVTFTVPDNWTAGRIWVCIHNLLDIIGERGTHHGQRRDDVTATSLPTLDQTLVSMAAATEVSFVILAPVL